MDDADKDTGFISPIVYRPSSIVNFLLSNLLGRKGSGYSLVGVENQELIVAQGRDPGRDEGRAVAAERPAVEFLAVLVVHHHRPVIILGHKHIARTVAN